MSAEKAVTIVNKLGLHARAAAKLVNLASSFEAEIRIEKNGKTVNGKSIMGILMLAAGQGSELKIQADGADADAALDRIAELVAERFGEEA